MTQPAALITGGTSGIGLATAQVLHERGFGIAVTGRSADGIAAARAELPDDALIVQADSQSLADADVVVDQVRERFGHLNAIFLNAGANRQAPLPDVDEAMFDDLFAVNTKGAFFTLQKAYPLVVDGASVVFTVGTGVQRGIPGGSVVSGSRGALLAMVPSLAKELAPRGIRVNAVSPGAIDTPMWHNRGSADEVSAMMATVAAGIPFGRFGTVREIAETMAFLASDGASYITGQNIVVAGGG